MTSAPPAVMAQVSPAPPQATLRMLVSVRNVEEALAAVQGGADFIDLKEPRNGALGGLPPAAIREIVCVLRQRGIALPISATIGDLPMSGVAHLLSQVEAVAACGVDYVKVGIERHAAAASVIDALVGCGCSVVPVFIADRGLDEALLARVCAVLPAFPAVMIDTADKRVGTLFDVLPSATLQRFIAMVRASGSMVGVAGALRLTNVDQLAALQPDFAGFRSAVCTGDRASRLDAVRVRELSKRLRAAHAQPIPV